MFDELKQTVSTLFAIAIIVVIVYIVIVIVKIIQQNQAATERAQKEQEEYQNLINSVISDVKRVSMEALIHDRDEVLRAYNLLYDCKQRGAMQIKESVFTSVGNDFPCTVDLKTSYTILEILNEEIQKRQS